MAGFQITSRDQCRASCKGCSLGGGLSGVAHTLPSILKMAQVRLQSMLPSGFVAEVLCSYSGLYRPSACCGMIHERSRSNLLDSLAMHYQYHRLWRIRQPTISKLPSTAYALSFSTRWVIFVHLRVSTIQHMMHSVLHSIPHVTGLMQVQACISEQ